MIPKDEKMSDEISDEMNIFTEEDVGKLLEIAKMATRLINSELNKLGYNNVKHIKADYAIVETIYRSTKDILKKLRSEYKGIDL